MRHILFIPFLAFCLQTQAQTYTRQDTLRGSITDERIWWDLLYYHLDIDIDPIAKTIEGSNTIRFQAIENDRRTRYGSTNRHSRNSSKLLSRCGPMKISW